MAHHAAASGDVALFERLVQDQLEENRHAKRFPLMWLFGGKSNTKLISNSNQRLMVTSFNSYGFAPIHTAAFHGHTNVIDILIGKLNVDVNQPSQNDNNWTFPLHLSILCNHVACVKLLLLKHRANPWLRDGDGWDAWEIASRSGHRRCLVLLNTFHKRQSEQCFGIVEAGLCTFRASHSSSQPPALLVDCLNCNLYKQPSKFGTSSDSALVPRKIKIHHGKGLIPYGPWDVESGIAIHEAPTYSSLDLPSSNRLDTSDNSLI